MKHALGMCYQRGDGVNKDLVQAASLFRMAAQQGDRSAQWELALLCYHGTDGYEEEQSSVPSLK